MAEPTPLPGLAEEAAREAALTAALEAQIAAQRHDPAAEVAAAGQIMDGVAGLVRKRWGPWPWVRRTALGQVQQVDLPKHRTRTSVAPAGVGPSQPQTVKFGLGTPRVGGRYPVEFPVRLPDPPTRLITGPVPAGDPWLKAPSGATWVNYIVGTIAYRVPFPPFDPTFAYAATDVVPVALYQPSHGGFFLNGSTAGNTRFWTTQQQSGVTLQHENYGWANYGVGTELVVTRTPGVFLVGTSTDPSLAEDVLLGWQRRSEPAVDPYHVFPGPYFTSLLDLVLSRDGGATWVTVYPDLVADTRIFVQDGLAGPEPWERESVVSGQAVVLAADGPWGVAGDVVALFVTRRRSPDPFPEPTATLSALNGFFSNRNALESWRLTLYVSRNGGVAQRVEPPYPVPLIFSDGAQRSGAIRQSAAGWLLWGGWQDHFTSSGPALPYVLYRGGYLVGGTVTWVAMPHQHLVSVSSEGTAVLAWDRQADSSVVIYFSVDSGDHWLPFPLPPGATAFDVAGALITDE